MKTFLKKKIEELNTKKAQLVEISKNSEDVTELKGINTQMEALNIELDDFKKQLGIVETGEKPIEQNPKGFDPISEVYGLGRQKKAGTEENDVEYRKAFMNYVVKGTPIPAEVQKETGTVTTADIGAVIPQTIVQEIVRKLKEYGNIFSRIRQSNITGGVSFPIENIVPTAMWVAEGSVAEKSKDKPAKVTFNYHKLQCRVGIAIEASVTSLPVFESAISEDVYRAMIIALEKSIIDGTGANQPTGFTKKEGVTAVEVADANLSKYETYTDIRAKLKSGYRSGAVWLLSQSDWDRYIVGMTDSTGQPIARVTAGLNGVPEERLLGIPALLVDDDYIKPFSEAATGDIFGALVNLNYYAFNSNMQINLRRYFDENTDEYITKSTLLGDGGLLLNEAAVLLKKA